MPECGKKSIIVTERSEKVIISVILTDKRDK